MAVSRASTRSPVFGRHQSSSSRRNRNRNATTCSVAVSRDELSAPRSALSASTSRVTRQPDGSREDGEHADNHQRCGGPAAKAGRHEPEEGAEHPRRRRRDRSGPAFCHRLDPASPGRRGCRCRARPRPGRAPDAARAVVGRQEREVYGAAGDVERDQAEHAPRSRPRPGGGVGAVGVRLPGRTDRSPRPRRSRRSGSALPQALGVHRRGPPPPASPPASPRSDRSGGSGPRSGGVRRLHAALEEAHRRPSFSTERV